MSTEEAARGAVGLPRGGPEESEGGPAAASAAAAEPLALADGWEDWPEEVWAEFRRGAGDVEQGPEDRGQGLP